MAELPEKNESLWVLAAPPAIWGLHFLVSYVTAAVWCAKVVGRDGPLTDVRIAIAVFTAVALLGIGAIGWVGYRRSQYGTGAKLHEHDTPEDRHRFLGFATLLLSGLSFVATVYVALTAVFVETCH